MPGKATGRRAALALGALSVTAPPRPVAGAAATPAVHPRLGVYRGAGCDSPPRIAEFGRWLGRQPGWAVDFLACADMPDIINSARWALRCWRGAPYRFSLAVPLLTTDRINTLAQGAAGKFDATFQELGRMLVQEGHGAITIRLAWEFNGDWMPWVAAPDPAAFIAYWRRVVGILRATPGTDLRFEWAPSLGRNALDPELAYPGDDVVDLIGMSVYNQHWQLPQSAFRRRWAWLRDQPNGLAWQRDFARARGKPRSFPEWGTGTRPDGAGGGDDPYFIEAMAEWLDAPDVAYFSYWDWPAPDYDGFLSNEQYPRAAAAFRRLFGAAGSR